MKIEFKIDQDGHPRASVADDKFWALTGYLEQDVQSDPRACDEILERLREVASNIRTDWEEENNAFNVKILVDSVTITCIWNDEIPTLKISHNDFASAITSWKRLLEEVA